ncbi:appetite-regulating hormone [Meleagris gallopavo]|uniref:Appetite-regulating hormone n=1 Tax=Meleagris gallopavo TaxID=9103 RepID=Q7T1B9_MELGA|nr:appetite-regulating hormone [Meleagris gallopavo]XP_031411489.1 appetite-regulating hormone [Meleagris gallopavo]AAP93133.1 preproghrelin [Meleagris gallopavo]AAR90091.1 preproghrelin [Meleagris gallopavo]
MFLRLALLGILLLSILGTETAQAGSSFLSPAYKNIQQQKDTRKPTARLHPRGTESFWDTDETAGEDDNNSVDIKFNVPFEIGVKITEREYQEYGQALEKMLQDIFEENAKETQTKD